AGMTAWLLDQAMRPIPGSEARSRMVASEGEWTPLELALRGQPNAAWIQIELQLLQPSEMRAAPLSAGEVSPADYRGRAWFDDVAIYQTPRVTLRALAPA